MEKILHKIKENRVVVDVSILIVIAVILFLPMLNKRIDIYVDDGSQHLMRAYYTYQSMLQNGNGNVISVFSNGFGYAWNLFYGPFSTYLIMGFGIVFGSFNVGFKVTILVILLLAGLVMYQFMKEMTDNKNTALLAGIIYMTSPYFFTDLYVRHAMR